MTFIDDIFHQFKNATDNIALQVVGESPCTYNELQQKVYYWKNKLIAYQLQPQSRIVLLCDKSYDVVAIYLACLSLKLIVVPVWKMNPIPRNLSILEACQASLVISNTQVDASLVSHSEFDKEVKSNNKLYCYKTHLYSESMFKRDIGVILFTSGSTGVPKGVAISVQAIHAFVKWANHTFEISSSDKLTSIAPFHFDLSLLDLFSTLSIGASVLLLKEEQVKNPLQSAFDLNEFQPSIIYATPTFLSNLQQYGKLHKYPIQSIQKVLFAGEIFHTSSLHALMKNWSESKFYNLYGPTETNVCTYFEVKMDESRVSPYPIGKTCSHMECIVKDEELMISGESVMEGYWNLERESTWYVDENEKRWYRSGDLVQIDTEGNFLYAGRIDRMIKRRGYRIEPAEIESNLQKLDFIHRGICLPMTINDNQTQIIYYFEANSFGRVPDNIEWKKICKEILPEYFIPDQFIQIQNFPETSSGKIDTKKLLEWNF